MLATCAPHTVLNLLSMGRADLPTAAVTCCREGRYCCCSNLPNPTSAVERVDIVAVVIYHHQPQFVERVDIVAVVIYHHQPPL